MGGNARQGRCRRAGEGSVAGVTGLLARAVPSQVLAGRHLPGMATNKKPVSRSVGSRCSSRHEIAWSGSAAGSASFNSEAAAVGMG
jgi:hypothetical protein